MICFKVPFHYKFGFKIGKTVIKMISVKYYVVKIWI